MSGKISPVEELVALRADFARVQAELESASKARDAFEADNAQLRLTGSALVKERDEAKAELNKSEGFVAGLKTEISNLDVKNKVLESKEQDLTKRSNALVQDALLKHGHPPMKLGKEDAPGSEAENPLKGLHGIDLAVAANKLSKLKK